MSTPAALISAARSLITNNPDDHGLMDRLSIWRKTLSDGGATGDTLTIASIASSIPVLVEPAGRGSQIVVGGQAYLASHRLLMIRDSSTLSIKPEDTLKVAARDGRPEQVFEQPAIIDESTDVLVTVAATFVRQGFRQ